jgi:hypothetical protein
MGDALKTMCAAAVVALAGSGCASFATFQEMDTLAKGDGQFGMGATVSGYQVQLLDEEPSDIVVPALSAWYRHGVAEHLEVHGRVWLPLGATLGAKYQLLGDRTEPGFGMSLGLDAGYLTISSGSSKSTIVDTYVPVYLGLRGSEGFATYLVPKYLLRTSFGTAGTNLGHMAGGTLGLAAGKKTTFYLEGSGIFDVQTGSPSWTGGIGLGF